jgi:hypothetical protein
MTITHPVTLFSGSAPSGSDATVFPSRDAYAVFDGVDDYMSIPHSDGFNFGTGEFSASVWVKLDNTSDQEIITKALPSGSYAGYTLRVLLNKFQFNPYNDVGSVFIQSHLLPPVYGIMW